MKDKTLRILLIVLVLTAFTSGIGISWLSYNLNFSQIVSIVLFFALTVFSLVNSKRFPVLYQDNVSLLIYFYFVSNLFSSLFFSPNKTESLKGCAIILSYVLIYVTTRWAMRFVDDKSGIVRRLINYNTFSGLVGLVCMVVAFATGGENFGISYGHLAQSGVDDLRSPIPSIKSFSIEPNLFAIITAVIFCLTLSKYLFWKRTSKQSLVIAILSASIIFSYTRSVYVALLIALMVMLVLSNRVRQLMSVFNLGVISVFLALVVYFFLPESSSIKTAISSRVTSVFDFEKGSGLGRVQGYLMGMEGFFHRPIFGNGTLSADTQFYNVYRKIYQERMGSAGWLNGVFIQSLHDTGILGLLVVIAIYISIIRKNYNIFKRLEAGEPKSVIIGFLAGNIILLITSQFSSTLWISFPYIYWGINLAYLSMCQSSLINERPEHLKVHE